MLFFGKDSGKVLEVGLGVLDKGHQDPDGDAGRKRLSRLFFLGHGLALCDSSAVIGGQIDVGAPGFHPLHSALAAELNQDAVASAMQFLPQCLGCHAGGAAGCQVDKCVCEGSCAGESNLLIEPQAFPAESRDGVEGVPGPVVGEAAVVSGGSQKPSNGGDGVIHFDSQRLDLPAGLLGKQGCEACFGVCLGAHKAL